MICFRISLYSKRCVLSDGLLSNAVDCFFKKDVLSGRDLIAHIFNHSTQKEAEAGKILGQPLVYKLRALDQSGSHSETLFQQISKQKENMFLVVTVKQVCVSIVLRLLADEHHAF